MNLSALTQAVLSHLDGDTAENRQICLDAAEHGADAGWPEFTYYTDTSRFFVTNRAAIKAAVKEDMSEQGVESVGAFLASFGCLKGNGTPSELEEAYWCAMHQNDDTDRDVRTLVENALAWYALEKAGWELESAGDIDDAEHSG